jgi:putative ABC transport system ATP-binding protein
MHAVELRNVRKKFMMGEYEIEVLKGISFKISKGEFVSIIGPSGSGKSTLLNMVGALDRPTAGEVLIDGRKISDQSDEELAQLRGEKIGFVFQLFNLIPRLTAMENVVLPMWFAEKKDEDKAKHLLKQVGLGHRMNNKPSQLSGGERQRVSIARALANSPEIIVADEPTGALDTKTGSEIIQLLKKIHKEGNTLILVTHDPKISSQAERIIKIKDGRIEGG